MDPLFEDLTALHHDSGWDYNDEGYPEEEYPESVQLEFYIQSWSISPSAAGRRFAEMVLERLQEKTSLDEQEILWAFVDRLREEFDSCS